MSDVTKKLVCVRTDKGAFLVSNLKNEPSPSLATPLPKQKVMFIVKDGVKIQIKTKPKVEASETKPIFKLPDVISTSNSLKMYVDVKPKLESSELKPTFNFPDGPSTSASVNITSSTPIDLKTILANRPSPKIGQVSFTFRKKNEDSPSTSQKKPVSDKPRRASKRPARYSDGASPEEDELEKRMNLADALAEIVPDTIERTSTQIGEKCGCVKVIPEIVNHIRRISSRLDVLSRIMQSVNKPKENIEMNQELTRMKNENTRLKQQIKALKSMPVLEKE